MSALLQLFTRGVVNKLKLEREKGEREGERERRIGERGESERERRNGKIRR